MPETADHDAAADRTEGEPVWVNADGLTVEKVPVSRGAAVVAVHLTLTSSRDERSLVRVVDQLPESLSDRVVEFHPAYDPENWTNANGSVVYEAPMEPNGERTTVYGVEVDDAEQRELFSTPPAVESAVLGGTGEGNARPSSSGSNPPADADGSSPSTDVEPAGDGSRIQGAMGDGSQPFTFESAESSGDASSAGASEAPADAPQDVADHAAAQLSQEPADEPAERGSLVDALVDELEGRELSEAEREVISDAVDARAASDAPPDPGLDVDARVERLQERVADQAEARESLAESIHRVESGFDSLRDEVAAAGRQAADVDRLESRLDALAEQLESATETLTEDVESLRDDLEDLREALDEEVRWRTELRRFLSADSDE